VLVLAGLWLGLLAVGGCSRGNPASDGVAFASLVSDPAHYQGRQVCTKGVYLDGVEAMGLAEGIYQRDGRTYLSEPVIWLESPQVAWQAGCFVQNSVPPAQFCHARVCGVFEAEGQYGHAGGYRFQIRGDTNQEGDR
jgi:hypothetical protein